MNDDILKCSNLPVFMFFTIHFSLSQLPVIYESKSPRTDTQITVGIIPSAHPDNIRPRTNTHPPVPRAHTHKHSDLITVHPSSIEGWTELRGGACGGHGSWIKPTTLHSFSLLCTKRPSGPASCLACVSLSVCVCASMPRC